MNHNLPMTEYDGKDQAYQDLLAENKQLKKEVDCMEKALFLASEVGTYLWWCSTCGKAGYPDYECEHLEDKEALAEAGLE